MFLVTNGLPQGRGLRQNGTPRASSSLERNYWTILPPSVTTRPGIPRTWSTRKKPGSGMASCRPSHLRRWWRTQAGRCPVVSC